MCGQWRDKRMIKKVEHNVAASGSVWECKSKGCDHLLQSAKGLREVTSPDGLRKRSRRHPKKLYPIASLENHCLLWDEGCHGDSRGWRLLSWKGALLIYIFGKVSLFGLGKRPKSPSLLVPTGIIKLVKLPKIQQILSVPAFATVS